MHARMRQCQLGTATHQPVKIQQINVQHARGIANRPGAAKLSLNLVQCGQRVFWRAD